VSAARFFDQEARCPECDDRLVLVRYTQVCPTCDCTDRWPAPPEEVFEWPRI
jgi:hypothetical protein